MSSLDQRELARERLVEKTPLLEKITVLRTSLCGVRAKWRNTGNRAPFLFTASSIGLSLAQLLSGLIVVHYVEPRDMGLWTSANMALVYGFFVLAGVQNGLSRELPFHLGANNGGSAHRLAATALFYTIAGCALALICGMCTVCFLIWKHVDPKVIYTVAAVTLLVIFRFYQNYLFLTYRSKNSFLELAAVQVKQTSLALLSVPLLFLFGYGGLIVRALILAGAALYWMHRSRPLSVPPAWRSDSFFLLLRTGVPIFVTDYITTSAGTFDKVALLKFGGMESVGLYALALSVASGVSVIPQSIAHYIYPRMSHHYGRTSDPRVLWDMAWKITLIVTGIMTPIAAVGSAVLPAVVRLLFPKYTAGIHAAQIALFSAVACGAAMGANALASLKSWSHLFAYQLSYAGLLAAGPFLGIHFFTSPLSGVAYGMLAANVLGAILALAFTFAATHWRGDPNSLTVAATVEPLSEKLATVE